MPVTGRHDDAVRFPRVPGWDSMRMLAGAAAQGRSMAVVPSSGASILPAPACRGRCADPLSPAAVDYPGADGMPLVENDAQFHAILYAVGATPNRFTFKEIE